MAGANTYVPFLIFDFLFISLVLWYTAVYDFGMGGTIQNAPNLAPITVDTSSIIGILTSAYGAILKFVTLTTMSSTFAFLGIIMGALNIALIFIIIDTILP